MINVALKFSVEFNNTGNSEEEVAEIVDGLINNMYSELQDQGEVSIELLTIKIRKD